MSTLFAAAEILRAQIRQAQSGAELERGVKATPGLFVCAFQEKMLVIEREVGGGELGA